LRRLLAHRCAVLFERDVDDVLCVRLGRTQFRRDRRACRRFFAFLFTFLGATTTGSRDGKQDAQSDKPCDRHEG
jgi:hypothetical protein